LSPRGNYSNDRFCDKFINQIPIFLKHNKVTYNSGLFKTIRTKFEMNTSKKKDMFIIADGHVHIHDFFDIERFFEIARQNFFAAAKKFGYENSFISVLFLTESQKMNWFSYFSELAKGNISDYKKVKFEVTLEDCTLKVIFECGESLILIAGRQIVGYENLEVLALGIPQHFGEGEPVTNIIEKVTRLGGIPVIPWGVGKWMGKRGKFLKELLNDSEKNKHLFLGDNRNRPFFWPCPTLIKYAEKVSIRNLPGSDPLPFKSEIQHPGSYGFILKGEIDNNKPFEKIKQAILRADGSIELYGQLEGFSQFLRNQTLMQLVKKFKIKTTSV